MLEGIEHVMLRRTLRSKPSFVVVVIGRASPLRCSCAIRVSLLKMRISSFVALPSATLCDIATVRIVPPAIALNCTLHVAKGRSLPRSCGTGTRRSYRRSEMKIRPPQAPRKRPFLFVDLSRSTQCPNRARWCASVPCHLWLC